MERTLTGLTGQPVCYDIGQTCEYFGGDYGKMGKPIP